MILYLIINCDPNNSAWRPRFIVWDLKIRTRSLEGTLYVCPKKLYDWPNFAYNLPLFTLSHRSRPCTNYMRHRETEWIQRFTSGLVSIAADTTCSHRRSFRTLKSKRHVHINHTHQLRNGLPEVFADVVCASPSSTTCKGPLARFHNIQPARSC